MRISDWSSDVCSSDLIGDQFLGLPLDIGNIVLVPDLEHRIRKFTAPMLHQLPVAPIVAAKLAQVVGPDLTPCKVDPVTGQTGFDRMDRKSTRLNSSH